MNRDMNEKTVSIDDLQQILINLDSICSSLDTVEDAVCMNYNFSAEVSKTEITVGQDKNDKDKKDKKSDNSAEQRKINQMPSALLMEALENEGAVLIDRLQRKFSIYISERQHMISNK